MPSTAPSSLDPETRHVAELLDHPVRLSEYRTRFPFLVAGPGDPTWQGEELGAAFMINYHLYRNYFPLWAIGRYQKTRSAAQP